MPKNANNFKDLSGQVIRNWKVIEDTGKRKRRSPIWKCECIKCNKIWEVNGNSLRNNSNGCRDCYNKTIPGKPKTLNDEDEAKGNIFSRYKCEAKNRNLSFELTYDEFKSFVKDSCYYCNKSESSYQTTTSGSVIRYNGIDRVDNNQGYKMSNCVTCCKLCNTKKKSITPDMIKKAYDFLFGDKNVR